MSQATALRSNGSLWYSTSVTYVAKVMIAGGEITLK